MYTVIVFPQNIGTDIMIVLLLETGGVKDRSLEKTPAWSL
jgi:hypothetical protein